jgi:hypothetical protein
VTIDNGVDEDVIVFDCSEFRIQRPTVAFLQTFYYSGYKKMHTLKYEVGLSSGSGLPVSYNGPHRGPAADITIFQEVAKDMLINHSWVGLADGTYQGESDILIVPPCPYQDLNRSNSSFIDFLHIIRLLSRTSL